MTPRPCGPHATDQGDADAIAGRHCAAFAQRGGGNDLGEDCAGNGGPGGRAEEIPSVDGAGCFQFHI
jgi:hypothetical protein